MISQEDVRIQEFIDTIAPSVIFEKNRYEVVYEGPNPSSMSKWPDVIYETEG